MMVYYYRWLVVNNQETCFTDIVELIDGYYYSASTAKKSVENKYNFKENLFSVIPVEISKVSDYIKEKIE